jgi:hypothetical protein
MTTEADKAKMIYLEGKITGRAEKNADVTDMVKRVATRCAEIAETHASICETNMWGCPKDSDKMKEWELAMIEAEHIAKDIRKEFYLSV